LPKRRSLLSTPPSQTMPWPLNRHLRRHCSVFPKGRKIRVTDLALRVIEYTNAQIREQGAREAAGRPKLIAHYAALWPDGRPDDAVCIAQLGASKVLASRRRHVSSKSSTNRGPI